MDLYELQTQFTLWRDEATYAFQKVPGSAVLIRYVRSSYQNDPVRSALELVLVIFVIHYLFAPSYSTKKNEIKLTDAVRALRSSSSFFTDICAYRKSTSWSMSGLPNLW
jgi:serine palmitoyltransferase